MIQTGSIKLTKNTDPDKYKCIGYRIGFDSRSEFSFTDEIIGKKVIIFEAEMNSSAHIDNKNNNILISVQGPMQELGDTTLTSEEKFSINFT